MLKENSKVSDILIERKMIHYADVSLCTEHVKIAEARRESLTKTNAYITINPRASKARVHAVLDEHGARVEGLTMFYGIPFRFLKL